MHAYTSVRRQRLQQTRVPESSQPQQHGSASSDLHTDATDSDSDSPDDDKQALMPTLQPSTVQCHGRHLYFSL